MSAPKGIHTQLEKERKEAKTGSDLRQIENTLSAKYTRILYLEIELAYQRGVKAVLGFAEALHQFRSRAS